MFRFFKRLFGISGQEIRDLKSKCEETRTDVLKEKSRYRARQNRRDFLMLRADRIGENVESINLLFNESK